MVQILVIAVSLALDAFSVSVAGGIKAQHARFNDALKVAAFMGIFQGAMPLLGWAIGAVFRDYVTDYSNWIAFILLTLLGLKMIYEAFQNEDGKSTNILATKTLIILSIATSIDALVVGVTLSLIGLPLLLSALIIGIVTFMLCLAGFLFGKRLGSFFEGKVEIIGGIALIAIGIKLLLS